MYGIFFAVSLLASVVGAICGIGGGVIIKPVLDVLHLESVAAISFLSGCTVLCMSCYSVGRSMLAGERQVDMASGTPLALGAAVGGLLGKQLFSAVSALFTSRDAVGSVQALCLAAATAGTQDRAGLRRFLFAAAAASMRSSSISVMPL